MSWTTTTMASARMAPTASARDDDRTRVATRLATPVAHTPPEDAGSSDDHVTEVKHSLGFILNLASASTLETEPSKDAMGFSTATMDAHQQAAHADSSSGTDSSTGKAAGKSNSKAKRTKKVGKAKAAMSHAEKRLARKCSVEDCMNYTINKGLCFRHGGGKQCTMDGCKASAKIAGLCWKHGGSVPCVVDGCERRGKSRGLCWAHGGGTKCQADACSKVAVSNGFCWAHGGGKRCQFDGCQRPAYERTLNYCPTHFKRFENGEEVLEL